MSARPRRYWPVKPCVECGGAKHLRERPDAPPYPCGRCGAAGFSWAPEGARIRLVRPANDAFPGDDAAPAARDPMPATLDNVDVVSPRLYVFRGHGDLTPDIWVFTAPAGEPAYRGASALADGRHWRIDPVCVAALELWRVL